MYSLESDKDIILKTFRKLMDANALIKMENITYVIEHKTEDFKIYFTLRSYQEWLDDPIGNYWSAIRVDSEVAFERGAYKKVCRHIEVSPLDLMDEEIKEMLFEIKKKYAEQQEKQREELEVYMEWWFNE